MDFEHTDFRNEDWLGKFLNEDEIVEDLLQRIIIDPIAIERWLDERSWRYPILIHGIKDSSPEHAGCLVFAGMHIRNFYGMWSKDNPYTVFSDESIDDSKHPDNFSARVIERVKDALQMHQFGFTWK